MKQTEELLFRLQDREYQRFQQSLMPAVSPETVIGVRTPQLRLLAKQLDGTPVADAFILQLPHKYYEENNLHAFLIEKEKDFEKAVSKVEDFLPYVDNWATCDCMNPKVFAGNTKKLLPYAEKWISSDHVYTVRYGIGTLMRYFLDRNFTEDILKKVYGIRSEEYYVMMMQAWFFATALAKQYDSAVKVLQEGRLSAWVHNKTIRKAIESFRISDGEKKYLRTLRI